MTYVRAVVIVIALIVVGVLGGIPGIGQSGQVKAATAYWSTIDPVAISSWSNSATNGITIVFKNNGKNSYQVTDFTFDGTSINNTAITLSIGSEGTLTAPNTIIDNIKTVFMFLSPT